jgi:predicted AlkP superfamily pyrophosphatase or phosphodiesterase
MNRLLLLVFLAPPFINAQTPESPKPKLVVGIVVDQMRQEYLYRFAPKFGNGGFKRLMNEGFMLRNAHYNYVPTKTGPGHAAIYTGTTPSIHGIIGNDWYDKNLKKDVNCVEDGRYLPVGSETGNGDVSPWRMLSTTITDELKIATQKNAKVVSVSLKDRGAVIPAGHAPDGAFWFDSSTGKFISSTYYKPGLPLWMEKFNSLRLSDKYLTMTWNTSLPIDQYTESGPDDNRYETIMKGKDKPVFPYNLPELSKFNNKYSLLEKTPFANDLLTELVKAALDGENMGTGQWTDFLCISFSATDNIGHDMGPNSIEVEDTYIRLDKNFEDLLLTLDKKVGKGQYLVFLSTDHAVGDVPQYMLDMKMPGGYFDKAVVAKNLNEYLNQYYPGVKLIEKISNNQVFLDHSVFSGDPKSSGIDYLITLQLISRFLRMQEGISNVFTRDDIAEVSSNDTSLKSMVARGFSLKRSGDVVYTFEPGWMPKRSGGSDHGSQYSYDTHVPVIFFGNGIKPGFSDQLHSVTDIAPTLSVLLKIKFPSAATGQPIREITEK